MGAAAITHGMITFQGALRGDLWPVDAAPAISALNAHLADLGRITNGRLIWLAGLPLAKTELFLGEIADIRPLVSPTLFCPETIS